MTRLVEVLSLMMPDAPGYGDVISVVDTGRGLPVWNSACSCCPNWRSPLLAGAIPWWRYYGWIAAGEYKYRVVTHPKYGRCLLLNDGGRVASRTPNARHGGEAWLAEVFVHSGQDDRWRGSAGCITIPPGRWDEFIACFADGQCGVIRVTDNTKPEGGEVWAGNLAAAT